MAKEEKRGREFSTNKEDLGGILRRLFISFSDGEEYYSRVGIVKAVNLENATATVEIINGDTIEDIRLQQLESESGLLIVPSIGSPVMVAWADKTTGYINLTSHIDNIVFQNGTFGGLIKITEITSKLNELVSTVNEINEGLKTHTHTSGGSGSPTTTPVPPITVEDASDFNKDDYENTNFTALMAIQHGDILLNSESEIFGINGDLAQGDAPEQHVGAILDAHSGNFRKWPTLASNIDQDVEGPLDTRLITAKVQNSIFLDGWRGIRLNINSDLENINVTLSEVEKITDETSSLV